VSTSASTVVGTPLDVDEDALAAVDFGAQGLIPAVVQDVEDLTVLMVGYMDPEALRRTLATGRTWFWSRSRREYWQKGETSGDRQFVREVRVDCDGDTVVVLVDQHGRGACHTGERSCFYRTVGTGPGNPAQVAPAQVAPPPVAPAQRAPAQGPRTAPGADGPPDEGPGRSRPR
jgi:phosphoribosyl-AMP cyclohydrolase